MLGMHGRGGEKNGFEPGSTEVMSMRFRLGGEGERRQGYLGGEEEDSICEERGRDRGIALSLLPSPSLPPLYHYAMKKFAIPLSRH